MTLGNMSNVYSLPCICSWFSLVLFLNWLYFLLTYNLAKSSKPDCLVTVEPGVSIAKNELTWSFLPAGYQAIYPFLHRVGYKGNDLGKAQKQSGVEGKVWGEF